jgi:SnoaL-like domain
MKKFLFPSFLMIACFLISCNSNQQSGMSSKAKKNLDNAKAITSMFEKGDFSKLSDYIAADAVDHWGPKGEVKGLDSLKAEFDFFGSMMKDAKNEIIKEVADDDYVFQWIKQSWTAAKDDPMMHMKAGDRGTMETIEVTKHNADGKITDHWGFVSMKDMMQMMPQGNMGGMGIDTTKH